MASSKTNIAALAMLPEGVWPTMVTPFDELGRIVWEEVDALVDWYIEQGVAGIFAVCLSSEMMELNNEDRVALAARVVEKSAGRVPVVACGTFGGPLEVQAKFMREMATTGVAAVVVVTSMVAQKHEDDATWKNNLEMLTMLTPGLPLGLYECPVPYKRVITPELMTWVAGTNRFVFLKDTCLDVAMIGAKVEAAQGSVLSLFNAEIGSFIPSLAQGARGYCGVLANVCPAAIKRLFQEVDAAGAACFAEDAEESPAGAAATQKLQQSLTIVCSALEAHAYPASAKWFLAQQGVLSQGVCCRKKVRGKRVAMAPQELRVLEQTLAFFNDSVFSSPSV